MHGRVSALLSRCGHSWLPAIVAGVLLVIGGAGAQGLSQPDSRWIRVMAAGEHTRYEDEDPFRFAGATALTRSLYLAAGDDKGAVVALGVNALRLEQPWWTHETRRCLYRVEWPGQPGLLLEGFVSTGTKGVGGKGLHGGSRWSLGGSGLVLSPRLGWQRHWIEHEAGDAGQREQLQGSVTLGGSSGSLGWELGWLGQRRTGEVAHAGRALVRLPLWPRARLTLHGLGGRQEVWYDGERLVLHDSGQALTGMASATLEQALGHHLFLSLGAGGERVKDHESRWLFAGLGWKRETWLP